MRILVPSSDVTGWMLRACLWLLDKYWPEHPAVVIGGYTPPAFPLPAYATFHRIGEFKDYPAQRWSDGVLKFLEAMPDEVFLYHMDDFWLTRPVDAEAARLLYGHLLDNAHIARADLTADRANSGNTQDAGTLGHLRLISTPPNTPYQLSFQTGLWRRAALIQYLTPGESAGESEIRGAYRMTLANANVLGTLNEPVKYHIVMQHGAIHFSDTGYQSPDHQLGAADLAELDALGYLAPPEGVPA